MMMWTASEENCREMTLVDLKTVYLSLNHEYRLYMKSPFSEHHAEAVKVKHDLENVFYEICRRMNRT